MNPAWLRSQRDGSQSPEGLADKVETLIHPQAPEIAAFGDVNADMGDPFSQPKQRNAGDHGHQKSVDPAMGGQPPLPTEGLAATGALLAGHPVALKAKITDEVPHRQQQEETEGSREVEQAKATPSMATLDTGGAFSSPLLGPQAQGHGPKDRLPAEAQPIASRGDRPSRIPPARQPRRRNQSSSSAEPAGIRRICLRPSLISNSSPGARSSMAV